MNNYKHIILTRFNIPFIYNENKCVDFLFSEDYLNSRFELFEKYCFPSIKNQTNQNFIWLVFFDSRTPKSIKKKNIKLNNIYSNYIPIYLDIINSKSCNIDIYKKESERIEKINKGVDEVILGKEHELLHKINNLISNSIKDFIDKNTEYIITSRIDNDDCFHKDYIKYVQDFFFKNTNDDCLINFDNGIQYYDNTKILQSFYYTNNHFTTYIEINKNDLFTILFWEHYFIFKVKKVTHINTIPLWMEIVHGNNAINTIKLSKENKLILSNVNLKDYGINKRWSKLEAYVSFVYNYRVYLLPLIKKIIKKMIKK